MAMAIALHSFKIDADGGIRVQHIFYGETLQDAEVLMEAHADDCPKFGPAYKAGNTIQVVEHDTDLPTPDTVDDFVGGHEDDDDSEDEE
jgi:hypothetical protein